MLKMRPKILSLTSSRMNYFIIRVRIWKYFRVRTCLLLSRSESSLSMDMKSPKSLIPKLKGFPATRAFWIPMKSDNLDISFYSDCFMLVNWLRKLVIFSWLDVRFGL